MDGSLLRPIWSPASSAASVTRQDEESSMSRPGPKDLPEVNQRRKMYPKEQWLALKPIIKQMYVDEGQTFNKVAEYLREHHDFHPTKKQFMRKISVWGLEKNIKRDERRAILERLGGSTHSVEFEATMLRGRRLDKAKIERWKKREGLSGGGPQTRLAPSSEILSETSSLSGDNHSLSSEMELCNQDDTAENMTSSGAQLGATPVGQQSTFNPWLVVDIVGSPGLTGLIGALTLELCEDIPSLDLSAPYSEESEESCDSISLDEGCSSVVYCKPQNQYAPYTKTSHSVSFSIASLSTYFSNQSQRWMPGPLDELDPFPKSAPRRRLWEHLRTDHLVSDYSLKMKELECSRKFKTLKSMGRLEIINLVEDMRSIAWRHYELDQYRQAEHWWRRVVTSCLKVPGYQPLKVLQACLCVVNSVRRQGRYNEALSLHQGIHHKIMKLVGPDHELAIMSKGIVGYLRNCFGDFELEVAIWKELLQIRLLHSGTRSRDTLDTLFDLAFGLIACGQYREAETILCTQIQLDREVSIYAERDAIEIENAFGAMTTLAWSLTQQGRYEDSKSVLNTAERLFKDTLRAESPASFDYFYEKAHVLRCQGRLLESEETLRVILRHTPDYLDVDILSVMEELADLLMETGRQDEAAAWWQKSFFMAREIYGIEHRWSMYDCKQLGFCYAEQGRYGDAILHFQQTIEKATLSKTGDLYSRNKCIEEIQGWISEVEKMKRQIIEDLNSEDGSTEDGSTENWRADDWSVEDSADS